MPTDRNGRYVAGTTPSDQQQTQDVDQVGQYIPFDLLGSRGRAQAQADARAADVNRGYWDNLGGPSASELDSRVGQDAQTQALAQMQQWAGGGLTGADRGSLEASRGRDAQASGAQQQAMAQQAQARGVGGSGLDFATRAQAAQGAQQRSSDAESQMMQGAQQRALQAMQGSAALGGQIREQAGQGQQRAYENDLSRAAGATGQYGADQSARQASRDRKERSDQAGGSFLAELFG